MYTARAGNLVVQSFYPYAVRAIDAVFGLNDIRSTYRSWQLLTPELREQYLQNERVRAKMVELAEEDAVLSMAGTGGSY